jgi:putative PEP-CTERM system histidine kinase
MVLLPILAAIVSCLLAVGAIARNTRSVAHWSFALGMLLLGSEAALVGYMVEVASGTDWLPCRAWQWRVLSLVPGVWLLFSLTYSRGNHREFLRRNWQVLGAGFAVPMVMGFGGVGPLFEGSASGPDAEAVTVVFRLPGYLLQLVFLGAWILILLNLERTFRSAVGTMRWRIKLVMLGLALLFGVRIYTTSQVLLYRSLDPAFDLVNASALLIGGVLIGVSLARTRLLSVELYPSHAVLRHSLTILLAGGYLLIVGVLAKVVEWWGGTTAFPLKAFAVLLALVLLTLLLLSDRVGDWSQRFVSRHLRRPSYDYRQVWQTFSERISPNVTVPDLAQAVVRWISDTFHVLSATVWSVDNTCNRLALEASTAVDAEGAEVQLSDVELHALRQAMVSRNEPMDLETATDPWVTVLRRAHPVQFSGSGGNRLCLPLVHAGDWLGLVTLGDRVSGMRYSVEDQDLLRCAAGQVGAGLMNLRLARRVVEARELEAFQLMSAFFVHDLKNTASTLSLMLQNLPRHFDNPEFREDALGSLRNCVDRIQGQIARLSLLRQGLEINRQPADLNQIIRSALRPMEVSGSNCIRCNLQPVTMVPLDVEQTRSVITNLVLNGLEAVGAEGRVRVTTEQVNGCVILSVSDTGCGMDEQFIRRSLFRPFQSTKAKGTGIGLYHCKQVVEAQGGSIEVQSERGRGTLFRVKFPTRSSKDGVVATANGN